ncbi:hypothetical protein C8R47DRAFT_1154420 [Mycena vitilis]|nr:hypothetical protein C8R47DRAFT_1154420 [Mycena vitilis]
MRRHSYLTTARQLIRRSPPCTPALLWAFVPGLFQVSRPNTGPGNPSVVRQSPLVPAVCSVLQRGASPAGGYSQQAVTRSRRLLAACFLRRLASLSPPSAESVTLTRLLTFRFPPSRSHMYLTSPPSIAKGPSSTANSIPSRRKFQKTAAKLGQSSQIPPNIVRMPERR